MSKRYTHSTNYPHDETIFLWICMGAWCSVQDQRRSEMLQGSGFRSLLLPSPFSASWQVKQWKFYRKRDPVVYWIFVGSRLRRSLAIHMNIRTHRLMWLKAVCVLFVSGFGIRNSNESTVHCVRRITNVRSTPAFPTLIISNSQKRNRNTK